MENKSKIETDLRNILLEDELLIEEGLQKHTTFRIGGPAAFYAVPSDIGRLKAVKQYCISNKIHHYLLGKGSNVLFSDDGFDGVVIELGSRISDVKMLSETRIQAEAGISLAKLATFVAENSLAGFEFASGIPGTLGGAVTMNAGAYGGEIKDCLISATVLDESGNVKILTNEELKLGYRTSVIQTDGYVVLSAILDLQKGAQEDILEKMRDLNARRREKQPLEYGSAGSTFKRPKGYFAGKLIEDAGLRGYRIGDAMVSEKHCGFVINVGNATAAEVLQVITDVQKKVKDTFQVELEPEVRLIETKG